VSRVLIVLLAMLSPLVQATDNPVAKGQMDRLAETAIKEAVKVVQASGGFYPFALIMDGDEKVRLVGYSGNPAKKPTADDYVKTLFWQVRDTVSREKSAVAAVVVKPHTVASDQGVPVPGVWAAVDHRALAPWVLFLPFVPNPDGTYGLGEILYIPADEPLFINP
jgi:hypothetical protein